MAGLFLDSFEHGAPSILRYLVAANVNGTPTIVTTSPKNGSRCLEISAAAATEFIEYDLPASTRTIAFSCYIYFPTSLPGAGQQLVAFVNANGTCQLRYANAPQKFTIRMGAGADVDVGPVLTANTWYLVDIYVDTSGGTATMKVMVDGGTEQTNTNVQTAADVTAVSLGTRSSSTMTVRYDDAAATNVLADYPLGEHVVEMHAPVSDGTHVNPGNFTDGTTALTGTTTAWQRVDEIPWETATGQTRIQKATAGTASDEIEVNMEALTHATRVPHCVCAYVTRYDSSGTGNTPAIARVRDSDGNVTNVHGAVDPGATLTGYTAVLTEPAGGWTRAKLDTNGDLKFELGLTTDVTPNAIWQGCYVEYLLVEPSATLFTDTMDGAITPTGVLTKRVLKGMSGSFGQVAQAVPTSDVQNAGLGFTGVSNNTAGQLYTNVDDGTAFGSSDGNYLEQSAGSGSSLIRLGTSLPSGTVVSVEYHAIMSKDNATAAVTGNISITVGGVTFGLIGATHTLTTTPTQYEEVLTNPTSAEDAADIEIRVFCNASGVSKGRLHMVWIDVTTAGIGGVLTKSRVTLKTLSGASTPSGVMVKTATKTLSGSLTPAGAMTKIKAIFKTLSGAITPSGVLTRSTSKTLAGSLTPAGVMTKTKATLKTLAGAITPTGTMAKYISKTLAGSSTPSGVLTKRTAKTMSGSSTPSGVMTKTLTRVMSGALTPAGTMLKYISKTLSGASTPSGALTRSTLKTLAGSITPSGVMTKTKLLLKTLSGSITPSGALSKLTAKTFAGSSTPSGTLVKYVSKTLSGALTPSGVLTKLRSLTMSGAITPTGVLLKRTSKTLVGAMTPSGVMSKYVSKTFAGSLTPSGVMTKLKATFKTLTGSITPSGTLAKRTSKTFSGTQASTGVLTKFVSKVFSGSLTPSGAMTKLKLYVKTFAGAITPSGTLTKRIEATFEGDIAPTGSLSKRLSKTLSGALLPVGVLTRSVARTLAGTVATTGNLARSVLKVFAGEISPSAGLTKQVSKVPFAAQVSPIGTMAKSLFKTITSSLTPSGTLTTTAITLGDGVRKVFEFVARTRVYQFVKVVMTATKPNTTEQAVSDTHTFTDDGDDHPYVG